MIKFFYYKKFVKRIFQITPSLTEASPRSLSSGLISEKDAEQKKGAGNYGVRREKPAGRPCLGSLPGQKRPLHPPGPGRARPHPRAPCSSLLCPPNSLRPQAQAPPEVVSPKRRPVLRAGLLSVSHSPFPCVAAQYLLEGLRHLRLRAVDPKAARS